MESCCIYIYVLWIPSRTVVQCYYFVFHPHESAWWAPLNRFYAGLAGIAETGIGPILRVLHITLISLQASDLITRMLYHRNERRVHVGNEIKLGMEIPMIESRTCNIS